MRPVSYTSLSSADNPTTVYLGFIAEEMATIDPRLVTYMPAQWQAQAEGSPTPVANSPLAPDSVMYDRLTVLLVGAVQTLAARITALETSAQQQTTPPPAPSLTLTGSYGVSGTNVFSGPVTPITVLPVVAPIPPAIGAP